MLWQARRGIISGRGAIEPAGGTWQTVFSLALTSDATGQSGINLRPGILAAALSGPDGNLVRVTVKAASVDGMTIDRIYMGNVGASAPDFSGNQVQMFSGGNASFTVGAGASLLLDPVSFSFNHTLNLLFACHFSGTSSVGILNSANETTYFKVTSDESSLTTTSGYSIIASQMRVVSKVEVFA